VSSAASRVEAIQEDATGKLRLGCGVVVSVLFPIWVLLTASALQLYPDLRGQWVLDPSVGEPEFREFGFFVQWFRGGAIAALILALASPLAGVVALTVTAMGAIGRAQGRADVARMDLQAGTVALDVPIVVRKRRRGVVELALPVAVVDAPPGRRLIAKAVDGGLLLACALGGAVLGLLGTAGTSDWGAVAWGWPALGAAAGALGISAVQWAGVVDRGQTFGKMMVDIREIQGDDDHPPGPGAVALRHVLPGAIGLLVAALLSAGTAWLAVELIERSGQPEAFLMGLVPWVVGIVALPVHWTCLALLRSAPVAQGRDALHDRFVGTRVVRTAVGDPSADGDPRGRAS
jgi:hypothetical protein